MRKADLKHHPELKKLDQEYLKAKNKKKHKAKMKKFWRKRRKDIIEFKRQEAFVKDLWNNRG